MLGILLSNGYLRIPSSKPMSAKSIHYPPIGTAQLHSLGVVANFPRLHRPWVDCPPRSQSWRWQPLHQADWSVPHASMVDEAISASNHSSIAWYLHHASRRPFPFPGTFHQATQVPAGETAHLSRAHVYQGTDTAVFGHLWLDSLP